MAGTKKEGVKNVIGSNLANGISLYNVDLRDVVEEILNLQHNNTDAVIRELCTRYHNGVQSYTIEDVKKALNPGSWKYEDPQNLNSQSE